MKAKTLGLGVFALVAAFALVGMAAGAVNLPLQANSAAPGAAATSGADVTGHPSNETNGVPPGPPLWLNESAPYGPPEWSNTSGGTPTWLTLP